MRDSAREGNVWVWIGIIVVIVAVIFFVFYKPQSSPAQPPAPPDTPVFAPQGQTVSGFPSNLILDPAAQLTSSYSINYTTSTNQYTAQWNSSIPAETLYEQYQAYLSSNGWTITSQGSEPAFDGVNAENGSAEVNVTIEPQTSGTTVIVGYLSGQ